jgi:hypothetical protein
MRLDNDKHENLIQLLALLTTLVIFLTFATSLTLSRVWKLQGIIETELIDQLKGLKNNGN